MGSILDSHSLGDLTGFADGLNSKYQKKNGVKDESKDFGLSNQKYKTYKFLGERLQENQIGAVGKIPWKRKWQPNSSILAWRIPWTEEVGRL